MKNVKVNSESTGGRVLKIVALLFFTFVISLSTLLAQEALMASGGNASGSGGSVSYSVGQIVYTTNTGSDGSAAQGVQQSFRNSVVTGLGDEGISLHCTVYPNPATDFITIKVEDFDFSTLSLFLFDLQGNLLESKKIENDETIIFTENLVPSIYILKVVHTDQKETLFRIVKI